ncbi:MAG: aldo/keto reductase [Clostridia bacterium]|nr:aldo/keto reductase [Clostridia bacterium]
MKLNNGIEMPSVGIGTFLLSPQDAENSVKEALKMDYRLIDTANCYVNERAVGRGMKQSGVKREEIFLSTKLWPTEYENPNAVEETLERLDTDYIDLLFLHQPTKNWREGYKQLIKAYKQGKIKAIGVSNFEGRYIEEVLSEFDVKPQVIQVECHPFFPQEELRKITEKEDIKIMSWYPLGGKGMTAELLESPIVTKIAAKYGKSPAQVVLKWHTQMGFIVIPGSKNAEHIKDNIDIFDFTLSDEDMKEMEKLNKGERRYTRTEEALDGFMNWQPTYEKE